MVPVVTGAVRAEEQGADAASTTLILLGGASFGVCTLLTYLWPLWDERRQSLDDKIFFTLVVRA
jgi:hypothetical protein